jgi:hypothetical protein
VNAHRACDLAVRVAGRVLSLQPRLAEVVAAEPVTERADEHEALGALLSELAHVPPRLRDDRGRYRHDALRGLALRRLDE